jgi:hypothetical protein
MKNPQKQQKQPNKLQQLLWAEDQPRSTWEYVGWGVLICYLVARLMDSDRIAGWLLLPGLVAVIVLLNASYQRKKRQEDYKASLRLIAQQDQEAANSEKNSSS